MSTGFSAAPARELAQKIEPSGWSSWKQRQQPRREGRHRKSEQPPEGAPADWAGLLVRIDLADDLELFWLEGFGNPDRARKQQPRGGNDNQAFLGDLSLVFRVRQAGPPEQGTPIDPGALALSSMLKGNCSQQARDAKQDAALLQMQQMSYGSHLRVQGRIR